VQLTLSNPDNAILVEANDQATLTIADNDGPRYALTVWTVGDGDVEVSPPGADYDEGTIVTLMATPGSPDWAFNGWSGDLSGGTNPVTLTMDADKAVTATFNLKQYELITATVGRGDVTVDPSGGVYTVGMTVTLTAVAEQYWEFAGWSGDVSGSANPLVLTMDANKVATATFAINPDALPHKLYLPAILGQP
jgi:hypothetical protein